MVQKKGLKNMKFNFLEKQSSRREMLQRRLGAIDELDSNERNALSNYPEAIDESLRQSFSDIISIFDGLSPAADRRPRASRMAFSCPLVSAIAAFCHGSQIHGRI